MVRSDLGWQKGYFVRARAAIQNHHKVSQAPLKAPESRAVYPCPATSPT
jgi:hypothetical protein